MADFSRRLSNLAILIHDSRIGLTSKLVPKLSQKNVNHVKYSTKYTQNYLPVTKGLKSNLEVDQCHRKTPTTLSLQQWNLLPYLLNYFQKETMKYYTK